MDIRVIKEALGSAASFYQGGQECTSFRKVQLLDCQQSLEREVLYLGSLPQARELASTWQTDQGSILLLAETTTGQLYELPRDRLPGCVMLSRLSIAALYNRISSLLEAPQLDPAHVWKQVLSRQLVSSGEIRQRLFGKEENTYVQLLLLQQKNHMALPPQLEEWAARWFPDDLVIAGEGEIAVVRQHKEQLFRFPLPEGMEEKLEKLGCVAGIGNATRDCSMLRTICQMMRHMLRLRERLEREDTLCLLDQYQVMIVLDYCVQEYVRRNGHMDICYLAHPALIHLARYDTRHGTDLRQVLYHYLVFGGNIQRTAAALYMHRNTVMNKLKKISEMVSFDFSDGLLCQRLLLSCQLLEYAEKVFKQRVDDDRGEHNGST